MRLTVVSLALAQVFFINQFTFFGATPMLWLVYALFVSRERSWLNLAADAAMFLTITTMFRAHNNFLSSVVLFIAMMSIAALGKYESERARTAPSRINRWLRLVTAALFYVLTWLLIDLTGNIGMLNLSAVAATFAAGVFMNVALLTLLQQFKRFSLKA